MKCHLHSVRARGTVSIFFTMARPQNQTLVASPRGNSVTGQGIGPSLASVAFSVNLNIKSLPLSILLNEMIRQLASKLATEQLPNPLLSSFFSLIFISYPTDYLSILLQYSFPFSIINSCEFFPPLRLSCPNSFPRVFHLLPCKPFTILHRLSVRPATCQSLTTGL